MTESSAKHQRSSLIVASNISGRFCLADWQPWPCDQAPSDGSDGWDEDD